MNFEDFAALSKERMKALARRPDDLLSFEVLNNTELGRYEYWVGNKVWAVRIPQVENAEKAGLIQNFIDIKLQTMMGKGLFQPSPFMFRVQDVKDVLLKKLKCIFEESFGPCEAERVVGIEKSELVKKYGDKLSSVATSTQLIEALTRRLVKEMSKKTKRSEQ